MSSPLKARAGAAAGRAAVGNFGQRAGINSSDCRLLSPPASDREQREQLSRQRSSNSMQVAGMPPHSQQRVLLHSSSAGVSGSRDFPAEPLSSRSSSGCFAAAEAEGTYGAEDSSSSRQWQQRQQQLDELSPASKQLQDCSGIAMRPQRLPHSASVGSHSIGTHRLAAAAADGNATAISSGERRSVRKSVSFAELPSWRTPANADAAGSVAGGRGAPSAALRRASESNAAASRQAASSSDSCDGAARHHRHVNGQHADCGNSSGLGAAVGLQSWRESLKAHKQQQQQQQLQQEIEGSASLPDMQPVAVGAQAAAVERSSASDSVNSAQASNAEGLNEGTAPSVQPSSHNGGQLSSLLLQQLLQAEEEESDGDNPGLADAQDSAVREQHQQQQQPQVLAAPSSWAPALSPVREDALGEQLSPEKASCNSGAADGGVQQQTLQLRVALAAAQSELDDSRQLIELLSAEYPDTAQLLEAGAKQEQARQEVGGQKSSDRCTACCVGSDVKWHRHLFMQDCICICFLTGRSDAPDVTAMSFASCCWASLIAGAQPQSSRAFAAEGCHHPRTAAAAATAWWQ
jgi:hypothetical protein